MTSHSDVAERFAKRGRPLRGSHVYADADTIYSYGTHFPMAIAVDDKKLFVINGDTYGPTTSRHQSLVRGALNMYSDYEKIILPYSAVELAVNAVKGITGRGWTNFRTVFAGLHIIDMGHEINKWGCDTCGAEFSSYDEHQDHKIAGHQRWERHLLAPSVFSLVLNWVEDIDTGETEKFSGSDREYPIYRHEPRHTVAYFLSGFDETARAWNGGYFLSRLPKRPKDIDHAFEMLKPEPVKRAIAKGLQVRRQGDIFYVPDAKMTTRRLGRRGKRLPEYYQKPIIGWMNEVLGYEPTDILETAGTAAYIREGYRPQLLGTNHYATEAFQVNDSVYARGSLYHRPQLREPDHRTIKLGKVWGKVYRNTALGSWSAAGGYGRVD